MQGEEKKYVNFNEITTAWKWEVFTHFLRTLNDKNVQNIVKDMKNPLNGTQMTHDFSSINDRNLDTNNQFDSAMIIKCLRELSHISGQNSQ